jgi:FtsP/CotA-like multicopper oxidase with cupredoxin domain
MLLTDEEQRIVFRQPQTKPGDPTAAYECQPQRVRVFRSVGGGAPVVEKNDGGPVDPIPGPVLRARVGDIVQLTFVNQIDAARFGKSIDMGEKPGAGGKGCDMTNPGNPNPPLNAGYPTAGGDTFPDCFHGSSTGNIHFHGTHTNPNGTGDNVYLEIRPSPRDANNVPTITPQTANAQFRDFFGACEARLRSQPLLQWPETWKDVPQLNGWIADQTGLLQAYQAKTGQNIWDADQDQLNEGQWPQYYIGAFPYCFRLPEYTGAPQITGTSAQVPATPGPIMGQSPGTHWYHAHKHGSTAINVANGMTGVFILEGKYDDDLNAFYGDVDGQPWTRTQPVLVINQLGVSPNLVRFSTGGPGAGTQDKGPDFSVNGRLQPVIDMAPGEVQLWRIANTSGRSGAFFYGAERGFGFEWRRLAQDGVQFEDTNYKRATNRNPQFLIAAGNRADLLVKAPQAGMFPVMVKHEVDPKDLSSATPVILFYVRVRSDLPPATGNRTKFIPNAPDFPHFLRDITDADVGGKDNRAVTFSSLAPTQTSYTMHMINGHKFQDNDQFQKVTSGAVEQWKIVNQSYGSLPNSVVAKWPPNIQNQLPNSAIVSHPFHIHVNPFQISEIFDPNQQVVNATGNRVQKYVFYQGSPGPPPNSVQCFLDVDQPDTWGDCHNPPFSHGIWWDVFPIPSGAIPTDANGNPFLDKNGNLILAPGFFRMRSRFVDFRGTYVLHCHILAHEDRGMMQMVAVGPPFPPQGSLHHH